MTIGYGKFVELADSRLIVKAVAGLVRKTPAEKAAMKVLQLTRQGRIKVFRDQKETWGVLKKVSRMVDIRRVPLSKVREELDKVRGVKTLTALNGSGLRSLGVMPAQPRDVDSAEVLAHMRQPRRSARKERSERDAQAPRRVVEVESQVLTPAKSSTETAANEGAKSEEVIAGKQQSSTRE